MNSTTWKAVAGIVLIFILGWVGGSLVTLGIVHRVTMALVRHDPEKMATMLERQTARGLDLNDDQKKKLHELLATNIRERLGLQRQLQPQVRACNGQTLQQINALLTPAQQQKFQDNLAAFKKRFGRNPLNTSNDDAAVEPSPVAGPAVGAPASTAK